MNQHTKLVYDSRSRCHSCEAKIGGVTVDVIAHFGGTADSISARIGEITNQWPEMWQIILSDSFEFLARYGFIELGQRELFDAISKAPSGVIIADDADSANFCVLLDLKLPSLLEEDKYISWTRGFDGGESTLDICFSI